MVSEEKQNPGVVGAWGDYGEGLGLKEVLANLKERKAGLGSGYRREAGPENYSLRLEILPRGGENSEELLFCGGGRSDDEGSGHRWAVFAVTRLELEGLLQVSACSGNPSSLSPLQVR